MSNLSRQQLETIGAILRSKGKIAAVKEYKSLSNCSLIEAKHAIEAIEQGQSPPEIDKDHSTAGDSDPSAIQSRRSGCLSSLLLCVGLTLATAIAVAWQA